MSCIHVDTSGKLPLPLSRWVPTGRVETVRVRCKGPEQHRTWTWYRCWHCGAPGFKRSSSEVVYTWGPEHLEFVA